MSNNYSDYAHWLWPISEFEGGVIDFRDVSSTPVENMSTVFDISDYAVQESYMKNILRRFAAFYNRQGQPETGALEDLASSMAEMLYKESN